MEERQQIGESFTAAYAIVARAGLRRRRRLAAQAEQKRIAAGANPDQETPAATETPQRGLSVEEYTR